MHDYWTETAADERALRYEAFITRSFLRHIALTHPEAKQDGRDPLNLCSTKLFAAAESGGDALAMVRGAVIHAMLTTLDWVKKDGFLASFESGKDMALQILMAKDEGLRQTFNRMAEFERNVEYEAYEP